MSKGTVFNLLRYLAACVVEEKSEVMTVPGVLYAVRFFFCRVPEHSKRNVVFLHLFAECDPSFAFGVRLFPIVCPAHSSTSVLYGSSSCISLWYDSAMAVIDSVSKDFLPLWN